MLLPKPCRISESVEPALSMLCVLWSGISGRSDVVSWRTSVFGEGDHGS